MITVTIIVKTEAQEEALQKIQSATALLGALFESGASSFKVQNQQDDGYYLLEVNAEK